MSQSLANADGVPLFACTKCNSRHPFEDLSQGHQLCKDCKGSYQMIKCNYCRTEFQQDSSTTILNSSKNICKKCEQLQDQHGKPGPCAYCNIIAAFIGTKCQRCTNSEKKYGPPMSCEHCRQKCAFDRKDPESRKKVDGKLLCWLCTMAYKRTIAKARQKEAILKSSFSSSSDNHQHHRSGLDSKSLSYTSSSHRNSSSNGLRHSGAGNASSSANSNYQRSSSHRHSHQGSTHNHNSSTSTSLNNHRGSSSSANQDVKKRRVDLSSSTNGHLSSTNLSSISASESVRFVDPNSNSDLANAVTQLKDQVASLNKKLQLKEKELLSKDQQIADLKSTNAREQRELREKISQLQKQHTERISEMQAKMVAMQKKIASSNRASKTTNPTSGYVEPPLVI